MMYLTQGHRGKQCLTSAALSICYVFDKHQVTVMNLITLSQGNINRSYSLKQTSTQCRNQPCRVSVLLPFEMETRQRKLNSDNLWFEPKHTLNFMF